MKRSTRSFMDKVLRSGKRLFAHRYDETSNRMRIISLAFVDSQVNKIQIIDCGMEIDDHLQIQDFKLGKSNKLNHVLEIDQEKGGIELGESKEMSLVVDNNDHFDNAKRFGVVYTRKRKRDVLKHDNYDEHHRIVQVYKKRKKKVRVSFESGFDGNCGLKKGPVVFAASCSNESDDNRTNVCRFSCFVRSVLRYLRMIKEFSWGQFSSFLLLEPRSGIYSSAGSRFLQVSTCTTSHGLLKVYGSIHSIPFFTLNFSSLSFFLYIHASLLLKHAFLTYSFIKRLTVNNATNQDLKMPSFCTLERDTPFDILLVATKARSARKRIPRASLFNKLSEKKGWTHVESAVPVPGVREVEGFAEEDYVPFKLRESYISTEGDELFRTLMMSYQVYDMDSDDERWIRNYSHEFVSESTFEKLIDVFERGIFCSPEVFSEASSAVDWCLGLASKEVLNNVYMYWMTKRKKKRSALVSVFQHYKHKRVIKLKRVKRHFTSAVSRKKRSSRRRARQSFVQRQFDSKKAMLNDEEASIKVHETQEAAKRSEEASIVKRQNAQSLMEAADLAVYRATMALRIAEARAAGGSVDLVTVPAFGSFVV